MGILREIMGILRNFTDPKLRVLNYGFFWKKTRFFKTIMGIFTEITGIVTITRITGIFVEK